MFDTQRANQQLRMNLLSIMQQPLLTTRVITLEEAAKKRDSGGPIFKQLNDTNTSAAAPKPLLAGPLPSLNPTSIPPSSSWTLPNLPPASLEPVTPVQHNTPAHHRRTHNSSGRQSAVALPVPGSSPKTPPTFAPPNNFSWGTFTPLPAPPSNALRLTAPSPSSNAKFGLGADFRPGG